MIRELNLLRKHNISKKKKQTKLLLLAEGSLTLIALERFLRMFLNNYSSNNTLYNLLELSIKNGITINAIENKKAIKSLTNIRNTIMHANYEQAIADIPYETVEEYFKYEYIAEIEFIYNLLNNIVKQVDINTGKLIIKE